MLNNNKINSEELGSLAAAFTDKDQAFANGFTVGGDKFVTIRADPRSLYGKKVS